MLYTSNNLVRKLEIYAVNQNYHTLLMNNLSRYNWKGGFFYYLLFIFLERIQWKKRKTHRSTLLAQFKHLHGTESCH